MPIRNSCTEGVAFMYDSTTGRPFGPPFDTESELDDFLEFMGDHSDIDMRMMPPDMIDNWVEVWTKDLEANG